MQAAKLLRWLCVCACNTHHALKNALIVTCVLCLEMFPEMLTRDGGILNASNIAYWAQGGGRVSTRLKTFTLL